MDVLINSEREKNYQNIQNFEDQLKSENIKIKDESYTKYETGTEKAYESLEQFEIKLQRLGTELEHNQQLANGFDDENATNGCRVLHEKMSVNYKSMLELWDHIKKSLTCFNEIYNMPFKDANTEEIENSYRALNKRFGLIKNVKDYPVSKTFKSILNTWPGFIQNLNNLKEK